MYEDGEVVLKRILELVETVPEPLRAKCFEVLLRGYAESQGGGGHKKDQGALHKKDKQGADEKITPPKESDIPATALPRFKAAAKRLTVPIEKLEALFDFSVDPFALQPVVVPGKNTAEKNRQVALLAAARSYFAGGPWSADWQEVKKLCVDHNCYDRANHTVNLKTGVGSIFKNVEAGKPVELSTEGITQAEKLLKSLIEADE